MLIRDYLESLAGRGRTAPASSRASLSVWDDIGWPIANALICPAESIAPNGRTRKAPPMKHSTLRTTEQIDTNPKISAFKRSVAAWDLLMTYASLRFSDVQRLRTFEVNGDSIRGTLLSSEARRHRGLFWPWACRRDGIAGSKQRAHPILDTHTAYEKQNGRPMPFTFLRVGSARRPLATEASTTIAHFP